MFASYVELPFYPGPVTLHPAAAEALRRDYGPPRFGTEYLQLYKATCGMLRRFAGTEHEVVLPTGEGMVALWGAMKSVLKPGDMVLSVGTGVFGDGFADMAAAMGCRAEKISLPYDSTIDERALELVDAAIRRVRPVLLTAVHCETPSGTLNPLEALGCLKAEHGVPLFAVDAVASLGGARVEADAWHVDMLLGGSQKCFGCPADMSMVAVSDAAWARMAEVGYQGYDALLPFHGAEADAMRFPYTPNWFGVAALHAAASAMLDEGLEQIFTRHEAVGQQCREGLARIGLKLWTRPEAVNSPTVTAACVPEGVEWPVWRDELARRGLVVGGSLGPMAGRVFRLGHMGPQADAARMERALCVMREALAYLRAQHVASPVQPVFRA